MNRKYLRQTNLISFLFAISIFQTNCSQISTFNLYSTEEEMQIGYNYSMQIEQQLTLNKNDTINKYINDLGQRMVKVSNRSNISFTFKVVNDPNINAFAIPGGFCYVNTGLIRFADNEAEPVLVENIEFIRNMGGKWYYKGAIIEVVWIFEPDASGVTGKFMQGLSLGTKISDEERGTYTFDFNQNPYLLTVAMDLSLIHI